MNDRAASSKSADAYRTISEVAEDLGLPQHVLRFWETRFPQVKPLKRAGGRRFYRPEDVELLRAVQALLYGDGYTIKGVQRMLRDQGPKAIAALAAMPSLVARGGTENGSTMVGEAATSSADASRPAKPMAMAKGAVSEGDGRPFGARSSFESDGVPQDSGGDVVRRLRAVLFELAECEHLIYTVQNTSFSSQ